MGTIPSASNWIESNLPTTIPASQDVARTNGVNFFQFGWLTAWVRAANPSERLVVLPTLFLEATQSVGDASLCKLA